MSRLMETFTVGNAEIAALSDGAPDRDMSSFFRDFDAEGWTRALGLTKPDDPIPFNFGTFLIRSGTEVVLVDSGFGTAGSQTGAPGGGELPARLRDLGVDAGEITAVVHTHLHPDHCGWDLDLPGEGELSFPNATVYVHQKDVDHFMGSEESQFTRTAKRVVAALQQGNRLSPIDGEQTVTPSVTMIPTPGHTPGHCSVMVASGGEHLVITGDAAHHPLQFEHHDWIPAVDIDPEASVASRGKLANLAADRQALVTGGHWPILTTGHVRRVESGFKWEPA